MLCCLHEEGLGFGGAAATLARVTSLLASRQVHHLTVAGCCTALAADTPLPGSTSLQQSIFPRLRSLALSRPSMLRFAALLGPACRHLSKLSLFLPAGLDVDGLALAELAQHIR